MAKDDLFPTPAPTPNLEGGDPSPAPHTPDPTFPDIASALSHALSQHMNPVTDALTKLSERLSAVEQGARPPTPTPTPTPAPTPDQFLDRLMSDGEGAVRDLARGEIARTVVPAVKLTLEQNRESILESSQEAIDREFGKGTWAEHFAKPISEAIDGLPLEMQASRRHVREALSAVYGRLYMDPEIRATMESKRKAEVDRVDSPPMLTGFGRPKPQGEGALSPDERTFIQALARSGFEVDEASYREAQKLGGSESAWKAHFSKQQRGAR